MSKKALKLALEALGEIEWSNDSQWQSDRAKVAITALREALAEQPVQQEPWCMKMNGCKTKCEDCPDYVPPAAQRTWVGLTNNELHPIADEYRILFGSWVEDFARAIEAKLKEKNT